MRCPSSQYMMPKLAICDTSVNANSIPVVIVSAAKSLSSNDSYSSLSPGWIDDGWLISDSLHMYMTMHKHTSLVFCVNFSIQIFRMFIFMVYHTHKNIFVTWKFLTRNFQHKFFTNYGMFTKHVLVEKSETYLSLKTCQLLLLEWAWASYMPLVSWLSFSVCVSVCVVHSGTCSNS